MCPTSSSSSLALEYRCICTCRPTRHAARVGRRSKDEAYYIPPGIDIAIDKQTHLTVTGVDRQLVGQVAANIRRLRKPDPYKQKGVRYTGEQLKKKAGKTGTK